MKKILLLLMGIMILTPNYVFAQDTEYLPINYNENRYVQDSSGTTFWWTVIPAKYKMHYSYGKNTVREKETPTTNARRNGATLAINAQYMGHAALDNTTTIFGDKVDVSLYDFYMKPNTDDSVPNTNEFADYAKLYAVSKNSPKLGIDLSYAKNPNWCQGMCFMTLIRDGIRVHEENNNFTDTNATLEQLINERHPRTWIAIDYNGNQFVAVSSGRNQPLNGNDFTLPQEGLTYDEIIDVTNKYFTTNIKYLYNIDGGGSSAFIYKGNMINPKNDETFTKEREVYGIFYWKVDYYEIEYKLNGGILENGKSNPELINVDSQPITLHNPSKEGYIFEGWKETLDEITNENIKKTMTINPSSIVSRKYEAIFTKIEDNNIEQDNNINNEPNNKDNANNGEQVEVGDTFKSTNILKYVIGILLILSGVITYIYITQRKNNYTFINK